MKEQNYDVISDGNKGKSETLLDNLNPQENSAKKNPVFHSRNVEMTPTQ